TSQEAIHDTIVQGIEPSRSTVVFGECTRDADQRQSTFALARIQMTVAAGDLAGNKLRRFLGRVREETESPSDIVRHFRIVEVFVLQWILREVPRSDHRHAR